MDWNSANVNEANRRDTATQDYHFLLFSTLRNSLPPLLLGVVEDLAGCTQNL